MTDVNWQSSETIRIAADSGPFAAEVGRDTTLDSTVISLLYENHEKPAHSITVSIAPELGSNMFRFRVGEHEIIYCEQELLKRKDFTGNFVLWPLPNRIRNKRYSYQGKDYSLAAVHRPQGNAVLIHGLVLDRVWQYEPPVVEQDAVSVMTYVDINPASPYYSSYPFDSRLSLTYRLTRNGLTVTYHVYNNGNQTLPFGFALHPYFSLLGGLDDTLVSLPADIVMEADDELLPTGRLFDVNKIMYAMYDLRKLQPVGNLKLDHVYTGLHKHEDFVIDYRMHGLQVHIAATDDFTHSVIYAPGGTPYFCLENQTCSTDAVNFHNQGPERREMAHLLEVPPGETSSGSIHYLLRFA
ncbi:MAG TPA: aldose 1-epimerase [Ktedonobacteraceae bacterium]|nr:aldose 1-epimerase [Ktedonobacteraceae bacterium]